MILIIFQLNRGEKKKFLVLKETCVIAQTCYNKQAIRRQTRIYFLNKQFCLFQSQVNTSNNYSKDQRKTTFLSKLKRTLCTPVCCASLVSVSFSSQSTKQKGSRVRGKDLKSVVLNTQRFGGFTSARSAEVQPNKHNFICRKQDPILQQE